jgi:drug/metabolite transporter (DMT)-like permease
MPKFFQKDFHRAECARCCRQQRPMKPWFLLTMAAVAFWGLYGVAFKLAADRIPPLAGQVVSSAGLLLPVLFLLRAVLRERSNRRGLWIGFASGLFGATGNLALFAALNEGGKAAIVFPLTALYPLITVIIAVVFMHEQARRIQFLGIAFAVVAVVLLSAEPGSSFSEVRILLDFAPWSLYAGVALCMFGLAGVFQKLATNHVSAETAFAMFAAGFIPVSVLICAFKPWPANLPAAAMLWAAVGGLFNGLGVLVTLAAFRKGGKAAVVTPLAALYPVVTVLVAVAFLNEKLNAVQSAGIVGALVGGLLLSRE